MIPSNAPYGQKKRHQKFLLTSEIIKIERITDSAIPDIFMKNFSIFISATRIKGARVYKTSNCAIGIFMIMTCIKNARIEYFQARAIVSLTLSDQIFLGTTNGSAIARI